MLASGRWLWDLAEDSQGYTLNADISGIDAVSFTEQFYSCFDTLLSSLSSDMPQIISDLSNLAFLGNNLYGEVSDQLQSAFSQLSLDGQEVGRFEILSTPSMADLLSAYQASGEYSGDWIRVRYHNPNSSSGSLGSLNGSQDFGVGVASLDATLQGDLSGDVDTNTDLIFGYDTTGGLFLEEGGEVTCNASMEAEVTGSASIPALAGITLSANGTAQIGLTTSLSDGDSTPNERLYLSNSISGQLFSDIWSALDTQFVGRLDLEQFSVIGDIQAFAAIDVPDDLQSITFSGEAFYDFVTQESEAVFPDDALLDSVGRLVTGISSHFYDMTAAAVINPLAYIPLVGSTIEAPMEDVFEELIVFPTWPESGLRNSLQTQGIEIVQFVTLEDLLLGTSNDIVKLRYQNTVTHAAVNLAGNDIWRIGELNVGFSGSLSANLVTTSDVTFGIRNDFQPYLLEGGTFTAGAQSFTGNVSGTANIGTILGVSANATINASPSVTFTMSDYDLNPGETILLFDEQLTEISLGDIFDTPEAISVDARIDADLDLAADPLTAFGDKLSFLNDVFSNLLTWTIDVVYDPFNPELNSYNVDANDAQQIADVLSGNSDVTQWLFDTIGRYNPIPENLRGVLSDPIPLINKSIFQILRIDTGAAFLLAPETYSTNASELSGSGVNLEFHFDASTITSLLMGQPDVTLVTLDLDQCFSIDSNIPIAEIPIFSFFGFANVDLDISLSAEMDVNFEGRFGIDTSGFYIDESQPFLVLDGRVAGHFDNVLSIGSVIDLVTLGISPGFGATGAIRLDDGDPNDDKIRFSELGNIDLQSSIDIYLNAILSAEVEFNVLGIFDIDLFYTELEVGRLSLYKNSQAFNVERALENAFSRLEEKIKGAVPKLPSLPNLPTMNDIYEAGEVAIEQGKELIDKGMTWTNDKLEDLNEGINSIKDKAIGYVADAADFVVSVFGGGSWKVQQIDNLHTFDAYIENGTLFVNCDDAKIEQYLDNAALSVNIYEDNGQIYINGTDFYDASQVTHKRRYYTWQGWRTAERRESVHFNNVISLPANGVTEIYVNGSSYDDYICLSPTLDTGIRLETIVIHGGLGNDRIYGGYGMNYIYGGEGNDTLVGGTGNDYIQGGEGNDHLRGGLGNDYLDGGAGNDVLDESRFDLSDGFYLITPDRSNEVNLLEGGQGDDRIAGSPGPDNIYDTWGTIDGQMIFGLGGNDFIVGEGMIIGGDGNDILSGRPDMSQETNKGPDNDNYIIGLGGDDTIYGGGGNDILVGDYVNNSHFTGDDPQGIDFIFGEGGMDYINGCGENDRLYGGPGADFINGSYGDDWISGAGKVEDGDPTWTAGDANDILVGGIGTDSIYGGLAGSSYDTFDFSYFDISCILPGEAQIRDVVLGNSGSDKIVVNLGPAYVSGGINSWQLTGDLPGDPFIMPTEVTVHDGPSVIYCGGWR